MPNTYFVLCDRLIFIYYTNTMSNTRERLRHTHWNSFALAMFYVCVCIHWLQPSHWQQTRLSHFTIIIGSRLNRIDNLCSIFFLLRSFLFAYTMYSHIKLRTSQMPANFHLRCFELILINSSQIRFAVNISEPKLKWMFSILIIWPKWHTHTMLMVRWCIYILQRIVFSSEPLNSFCHLMKLNTSKWLSANAQRFCFGRSINFTVCWITHVVVINSEKEIMTRFLPG